MPTPASAHRSVSTIPAPTGWGDLLDLPSTSARTPTGDGWATVSEIATIERRSTHSVGRKLKRLRDAGLVECFQGTQVTPCGCRVQTWWRRLDTQSPRR